MVDRLRRGQRRPGRRDHVSPGHGEEHDHRGRLRECPRLRRLGQLRHDRHRRQQSPTTSPTSPAAAPPRTAGTSPTWWLPAPTSPAASARPPLREPTGQAAACFDGHRASAAASSPATSSPPASSSTPLPPAPATRRPAVAGGAALVRQFFINQGLTAAEPGDDQGLPDELGPVHDAARAPTTTSSPTPRAWASWTWARPSTAPAASCATRRPADTVHRHRPDADVLRHHRGPDPSPSASPWPGPTPRARPRGSAYRTTSTSPSTWAAPPTRERLHGRLVRHRRRGRPPRTTSRASSCPPGTIGNFTVTVTAANINSDGVPGSGSALDQDFALVVVNGLETPVPNVVAAGAALLAEGCGPGNGAIDPGEAVTVTWACATPAPATPRASWPPSCPRAASSPRAARNPTASLAAGGAAVSRPFSFTAAGACGGTLTATLQLKDGSTDLGTVAFAFTLGAFGPGQKGTFQNTTPISLPVGPPLFPIRPPSRSRGSRGRSSRSPRPSTDSTTPIPTMSTSSWSVRGADGRAHVGRRAARWTRPTST